MSYIKETLRRMGKAWGWVAAQFWATLLIVLAAVGWTRLPDRHAWQVGLSILVPLVLVAAFLLLEAGTMRKLLGEQPGRVGLALGTLTLLVWFALGWLALTLLGWCDDRAFLWAGYLNSQAPRHLRATLLSYPHLIRWISLLLWTFRWIIVPGKLTLLALASAQWGWRLPWGRLVRLMLSWRWWLAVVIAALVGVVLPGFFFAGLPHGTLEHQVRAVVVETAGAFLLPVACWVVLLAWGASLLDQQKDPGEDTLDAQLLARLHAGRIWIAGLAIWTFFSFVSDVLTNHLPDRLKSSGLIFVPILLVLLVSLVFLQVALMRSMIGPDEKRAGVVPGVFMPLAWALVGVGIAIALSAVGISSSLAALCWVLVPGLLLPFFAASAQWGVRLPWRRVLRVESGWLWWLGVLSAAVVGIAIPNLLQPNDSGAPVLVQPDFHLLRKIVSDAAAFASWVFLMGWFAVLLARTRPSANSPGENALVGAPVLSGPLRKDSVRLPLPDSGGDSSRKA